MAETEQTPAPAEVGTTVEDGSERGPIIGDETICGDDLIIAGDDSGSED